MTNVSKSPERNTFQKEAYIARCEKEGTEPSESYLELFEIRNTKDLEWAKEEHTNDLEYDLRTTNWILEKARTNEYYAQNIYAALCNMRWCNVKGTDPAVTMNILKDELWSCSWRSAGGIVADMLEKGDYIDWYCSGMGGLNREYNDDETDAEWKARTKYVPEGVVTDEIKDDFQKIGWVPVPYDDSEQI